MGIFKVGEGLGKGIESVSNVAGKAIDKIPDENLRRELQTDLNKSIIELNKIDAKSQSWFNGSWRPMIGWSCAIGIFYTFIVHPILSAWFEMPSLDTDTLYQLVIAMLGMSGLRTFEKYKGVARN